MRNLKKFLALVLAMMMAFSLMLTASAANEADNGTNKFPDGDKVTPAFVEAVDVLNGMGVFKGRDTGDFAPGDTINRAETAAIIYRLITADVNDTQTELYRNVAHPFTDVKPSDWYAGYIGFLWNAGIIKGQTATTFNPYGKVTGYEALAMILRAVGYDQNHEFEGGNWVINVASISQRKGILKDVETANYGGPYLYSAARRDVVASLLFRTAAYVPQVIYTTAFSYTETGMSGGPIGSSVNPTLGEANFGLTSATGIVVGNQATGESYTKIGFAREVAKGETDVNLVNWLAYLYEDGARVDADQLLATPTGTADIRRRANETRSFAWETDLSLFNHAVKVWFNWDNTTTYALYDRATATAIVNYDTANLAALTPANLAALVDGDKDNANNWDDTVMYNGGGAYFNYSFAAMNEENYAANGNGQYSALTANVPNSGITATNPITALSPVLNNNKDNDGTNTDHGLYLLISNSSNKVIDVVISLDLTMTKVTQANTTTFPYSVGVLNANGSVDGVAGTSKGTNGYFGVDTDTAKLVGTTYGTTANYVSLLKTSLLNTTEAAQKLGTKVAAIEITGTRTGLPSNGTNVQAGTRGDCNPNTGSTGFNSTFYYQLTQPQWKVTDTVIKVDTANNDVYLKSGKVLHQSVFAEATDETFITNNTSNLDGIEGYDQLAAVGFRLVAGKDYTFTLDAENGNYIYWETPANTANFVYGTYMDFETVTASSHFDYPLVYVNANGEQRQKTNITGVDGSGMGYSTYDGLSLNKRDYDGGGSNSGYVAGLYIGYVLGDDGSLTTVTTAANDTGFVQDAGTYFTAAEAINASNVAVGAKEVGGAGTNMFLTENTQFYLVDGAGMVNQTVKPYKGISALMEGMDSVVIHGEYNSSNDLGAYLNPTKLTTAANEMFYYHAGRFDYDQNYDASALEIKTIFLPIECVEFQPSTNTSLVFVGNSTATMINSNNGNWASQFTVWQKGEGKDVWIEGDYSKSSDGNDANQIVNNGDNVFYELVATSKKASDGETIYNIRPVSNANNTVIGYYWDGTNVQVAQTIPLSSAAYTRNGDTIYYRATTFNQQAAYIQDGLTYTTPNAKLYNVGSAGIKNLNTVAYPGIVDNGLSTLNGAGSLINNDGVPVSCILDTDDAQRLTVSFIYVNADVNPIAYP